MTPEELLADADIELAAALRRAGEFDDLQLHYLEHADELYDPHTDGIDCDAEVDYG